MQISQLRAFCAVAQTESVTAAASLLNRVPSGVSVRIQRLEEDLQCQLFYRDQQRMKLAPSGRLLLEHAQRILDLTDQTRALLRDESAGGQLMVGALDVVLASFMPKLIGSFKQRHRNVNLRIRHEASEVLIQQVMDGTLDVALTDGPVKSHVLESAVAFVDEMLLVTERSHPPVTSPADLRCTELYGFGHDCSFRFKMDRWLRDVGMEHLPIIEIESYHTALACVSAGMGAAWITRGVLDTLPGNHLVRTHSLGAAGPTEIHFVWRSGQLSKNAERLMAVRNDLASA